MTLPEFLTVDDGGFIHVTGRRIGLHHVLRPYGEGLSPEEMRSIPQTCIWPLFTRSSLTTLKTAKRSIGISPSMTESFRSTWPSRGKVRR